MGALFSFVTNLHERNRHMIDSQTSAAAQTLKQSNDTRARAFPRASNANLGVETARNYPRKINERTDDVCRACAQIPNQSRNVRARFLSPAV